MSELLKEDLAYITRRDNKVFYRSNISISCIFHTEKKDIYSNDGIALLEIIEYRDYKNNFSDHIEAKFLISQGVFYYDILPYLDNLEVTIKRDRFMFEKDSQLLESEKYKAYFLFDKNPIINKNINIPRSELNNLQPLTITLQLMDRSSETIRIKTIQGHYDKTKNKSLKIKDVLKSIYSENCNKILVDNKPSIQVIEIDEPDNTQEIDSLVIPSYFRLIRLAEYIQNDVCGVYNSGIGLYIQRYKNKKVLFIYSLYDSSKFNKTNNKIIIYIPTDMKFSSSEKTYNYSNNILKLIVQPNSSVNDLMGVNSLNEGTGVRLANASSFMKKPVEIKESGPKFVRSRLNTEIVLSERKDGLNFASKSKDSITSNIFKNVTEIKENNISGIKLAWVNSYSDMIYPGAACKLVTEVNNKFTEIYGIVHRVVTKYSNMSSNILTSFNKSKSIFQVSSSLEIVIPKE